MTAKYMASTSVKYDDWLKNFDLVEKMCEIMKTDEELAEKCHYLTKKYTDKTILTPDKLNIICGSFYMLNEIVPESLVLQPFLQEGL